MSTPDRNVEALRGSDAIYIDSNSSTPLESPIPEIEPDLWNATGKGVLEGLFLLLIASYLATALLMIVVALVEKMGQ